MRLNLGCGYDVREDWENVDMIDFPGVKYANLDSEKPHLPYEDNTFHTIEASHVLEHITHILPLMEECWRVAQPNANFYIECPFGSSDDAYEDPTHVRRMFPGSFIYFAQPTYWRSDYGYKGDWKPVACMLLVDELLYPFGEAQSDQAIEAVIKQRNAVHVMKMVMQAVKPARVWSEHPMDRFETRLIFTDVRGADPTEARAARIEKLTTPNE